MTEFDDEEEEGKSKTQIKRELHALQDLGKALTEAPDSIRLKCDLPELIEDNVAEYKRLTSNGARKRQLQFLGKLLRGVDTTHIEAVLFHSNELVEGEKRRFHQLEELRDALVKGDSEILESLIQEYPDLDIQHVRQLIRQSQKEAQTNKPPAASRKLFQYLRELKNL